MQSITQEWVDKAEADFITAAREPHAQPPNYDAAAFLAQQSAEKYLVSPVLARTGELLVDRKDTCP